MIKVNIAEIKAKLSEYLDLAVQGEQVLICKHNRPVAELRAVKMVRAESRPTGGAAGQFTLPASFFDPLPDDLVAGFTAPDTNPVWRAAEQHATYGAAKAPVAPRPKGAARKLKGRARL
jgi:prevent-host-death family protein